MKISIIGTGYVGLTSGTCFAEVGHEVTCVDNNPEKVKTLLEGKVPIYEPGLEELVKSNVAAGRLKFTTSTEEGVKNSDVIFIAVPTPPQPDGSVDLFFGPAAPVEKPASNWIKTLPGKGWFSYFRLYGPTASYFDRSWVLGDFEPVG
jgi:UDP-glucose 6-dehydrogenase